jgi:hypothetical protein
MQGEPVSVLPASGGLRLRRRRVTAGLGGMQTANIALEGLRRAVAALNDLETAAALRKGL